MNEFEAREAMVMHGRSLHQRGFAPGSSGNLSVRLDDSFLITPTNSCLGRLQPECIARVDFDSRHVSGNAPSKESFLHLLMYKARPGAHAVVHLHSPHAVAVSCCADVDNRNAIPPLTPYYVMKVGRLPLIPYHPPGDPSLAEAVAAVANRHHAVLLANHGPVVAGESLDAAVYAVEELEEMAKLFLWLGERQVSALTEVEIGQLEERYPN